MSVIGWDIGGVHVKAARVTEGRVARSTLRAFSIERDLDALARVLCDIADDIAGASGDRHAITMTAELSQRFRTKGEGVDAVLAAHEAAFPGADVAVLDTAGNFITPDEARYAPLDASASNWLATALVVGRRHPDCLLVDMGSTTTDIIPIVAHEVIALGRTDPDRLASGELVYTGVIRTPIEAVVTSVPWKDGLAAVSAELFATIGDVHVWLGTLDPAAIEVPTADGRPASRPYAGERLARVVCADRTMIDDPGLTRIATHVAAAQRRQVAGAIAKVAARHPSLRTAVVTGLGDAIAAAAVHEAGLEPRLLRDDWQDVTALAPAAAVALLLEAQHG
ncbi:MAG: hydantoinase/oxoprolinase family protein [Gemmatimonadales bacterium]